MDQVSVERLAAICSELQAEPLFHLSMQSKELFHSNLLAWLCEAHPAIAAAVFATWLPEGDTDIVRVQRERTNLDLAVELPGLRPFVIENKVFSPPDERQLDDYAGGKLAGLADPALVLLSLGPPSWAPGVHRSPNGRTWQFVSYLDLAEALEAATATVDQSDFDAQIITHYSRMARSLHELAGTAGTVSADEPIGLVDEPAELLRGIRMHDAVGKLRARSAIAVAEAHTTERLGDCEIRWEAGFTNGSPLLAAFLRKDEGDGLGWQYQHSQWRVAVIAGSHVGRSSEVREQRHAYVAKRYASWFDFDQIPDLIGRDTSSVPPTESKGGYNRYDPDFVYRYRQIPDLTLDEMVTLSHHYLTKAAQW